MGTSESILGVGPLDVHVRAPGGALHDVITATLELFDVPWSLTAPKAVTVAVRLVDGAAATPARGGYLECGQMLVDAVPHGLRATTIDGALADGCLTGSEDWHVDVPAQIGHHRRWVQVEDLLSLIYTTGWRRSGWVPLHAAGLARGERGLLVCAASGGGKTTFSVAMLRRGWRLVGDDKLLLGTLAGSVRVAAVKHVLNLDPAVARWFPELSGIAGADRYSAWSPKRRVSVARYWPGAGALSMAPTHVVVLERTARPGPVAIRRLDRAGLIDALLRQTVIPADAADARPIVRAVADLAGMVTGLALEIPDGVYADPEALRALDEALA